MRVEEVGSKKGCFDPKYCQNGKPKSQQPNKKDDKDSGKFIAAPKNNVGAQGGSSTGGDQDVGYTIRYDVGIVMLNYYGQHSVINLEEIRKNSVANQALFDFEQNANSRVNALNQIQSAQRDLVKSAGETIVGGAVAFLGAGTPIGPVAIGGGLVLAAHGGYGVHNAAMSWGQAAQDNQTANANLSATWETLSSFP